MLCIKIADWMTNFICAQPLVQEDDRHNTEPIPVEPRLKTMKTGYW